MCIRDSRDAVLVLPDPDPPVVDALGHVLGCVESRPLTTTACLLYTSDAAEQAGRGGERPAFHTPEDVAERIDSGRVWIWEDEDGIPVHLTGHSLPAYGVSRIGPVYTARQHRGKGYASAAVAQVSRMLCNQGIRTCLFTDQANPTSNRIYLALGYRPVVDMANLLIS